MQLAAIYDGSQPDCFPGMMAECKEGLLVLVFVFAFLCFLQFFLGRLFCSRGLVRWLGVKHEHQRLLTLTRGVAQVHMVVAQGNFHLRVAESELEIKMNLI